jgi:hypothetical protein
MHRRYFMSFEHGSQFWAGLDLGPNVRYHRARTVMNAPLAVLLSLAAFLPVPAEKRTYVERKGGETSILYVAKERAAGGWIITATAGEGGPAETQVYTLDASGATSAWTLVRPGENTDIRAVSERDVIILSGRFEGRSIQKKFKTGPTPWNQAFQLGLESFALENAEPFKFLAIGTSGIGAMKIAAFTAKIEASETIRIGENTEPARRVRLTLSGLKSVLWHGDYWYRATDGAFIRYVGRSGIGAPLSVMDLAGEKETSIGQHSVE